MSATNTVAADPPKGAAARAVRMPNGQRAEAVRVAPYRAAKINTISMAHSISGASHAGRSGDCEAARSGREVGRAARRRIGAVGIARADRPDCRCREVDRGVEVARAE